MSLQEKLAAHKAAFIAKVPPESLALMRRATEELRNSGILDNVLKVGDRAPSFTLPNTAGERVSSDELLRHGPLIITFYRGVW